MKLVGGGDLGMQAERFRDDHRRAASLMAEVARAVHFAHQRGILHRDLKPSNILLDEGGCPYVADFGLARRLDQDSELTMSGAVLGTPTYMAPEQASGDSRAVTTAADIYDLGAILYRLLTGRPPVSAGSNREGIEQLRQGVRTRPSSINPRVDRDLETICLKCLDQEPDRRYGSCDALAQDLDRWLRREPTTPAGSVRPSGSGGGAGAIPRSPAWRERPSCSSSPWPSSATATAFSLRSLAARAQDLALAKGLALQKAQESDDLNRWRLIRLDVANGIRLLDQGDPAASLVWFAEAFQRDRSDPEVLTMHQARMAATLRYCPRLVASGLTRAP